MKVGIITQHRVIHFGSVLQAFALQQALYRLNIDNEIIDYIYPNKAHLKEKKTPTIRSFISRILRKILSLAIKRKETSEPNKIRQFISERLKKSSRSFKSPTDLANNCPKYDIYLTGSDQVWNTDYLNGDTSFFFSFVCKPSKKVSYASSFGRFSFSGDEAKKWLSNLNDYASVSVRERKAVEIINKYTGINAVEVLDPTLLLNTDYWLKFAGIEEVNRKKFILVYILTYAWNPFPYAEEFVRYYEDLLGYEVLVIEPEAILERNPSWKYLNNPSPEDFVKLFAEASLVITTSFHGLAFSISLKTPFFVITKDNNVNDDRIQSLLKNLNLSHRGIPVNSSFPEMAECDFSKAYVELESRRNNSIKYLKENLK